MSAPTKSRADRRLDAIRKREVEARTHHRELADVKAAADQEVARLEAAVLDLEAAALAGRGERKMLDIAQQDLEAARKAADIGRDIEIAGRAVALIEAERQEFVVANAAALLGSLQDGGTAAAHRLAENLAAVSQALQELAENETQLGVIARAIGRGPETQPLEQRYTDLRRTIRAFNEGGPPAPATLGQRVGMAA